MQIEAVDGLSASVEDGVARVLIDRPARKNAVTLAMWNGLADLFDRLGDEPRVRVVVLAGAGDDFSAGADISEFDTERGNAASARNYEAANSRAFAAVRNCRAPVIASIKGVCFGGGFGLAAAADLRIATPDASFSVPAAKLGLAYPLDAMVDIVSSLGPQMARYLAFSAARIDAQQALAAGFLLEICEKAKIEQRALDIAMSIAANAPLSIEASKRAIATVVSPDADRYAAAQAAGDRTFDSADYAEGRTAFKEKRKPLFVGK